MKRFITAALFLSGVDESSRARWLRSGSSLQNLDLGVTAFL